MSTLAEAVATSTPHDVDRIDRTSTCWTRSMNGGVERGRRTV